MFDDYNQPIDYEILSDGSCSYCGCQADWIALDDFGHGYSVCTGCESFNDQLELDFCDEPLFDLIFPRQ